jgi:Uma2 family endonuclease
MSTAARGMFWSFLKPTAFTDFLKRYGEDPTMELLNGTAVEKMPSSDEHDEMLDWLSQLFAAVSKKSVPGNLLGPETAVEINSGRARRPDLHFVRRGSKTASVRDGAVFGAPDLVVEVVCAKDFLSDVVAREKDYRERCVSEILFIDQSRRRVRIVRRQGEWVRKRRAEEAGYVEEVIATRESIPLYSLNGFLLNTEWLFVEPRPRIEDLTAYSAVSDTKKA